MISVIAFTIIMGCGQEEDTDTAIENATKICTDNDKNGFCDDAESKTEPVDTGAPENPSEIPCVPIEPEIWYNGIDDDGCGGNDFDADKDGFVRTEDFGKITIGVQHEALPGGDCDDDPLTGVKTHPNVTTNETDNSLCYRDNDGDGFGDANTPESITAGTDCNDDDTNISPNATEICDGVDTKCTGSIPEDEVDNDGDGYVECPVDSTEWKGAEGILGGDCNDEIATIYPEAPERCDGEDTMCNGSIPEDEVDNDGDGYVECTIDSAGWQGDEEKQGSDCDDEVATIYPNAQELCDGILNKCGGNLPTNEIDNDSDGYVECTIDSSGWQGDEEKQGSDCDDNEDTIYPNAPELCDGQDNNCDNDIPNNETDDDDDGYVECTIDSGGWDNELTIISGGGDCDDNSVTGTNTHPNITTNETDDTLCYRDNDEDGFGDSNTSGSIQAGTDCNDDDATVRPNAAEICDGQDTQCNGSIPEDEVDNDGDGYVECMIDSGGWDGPNITGGQDCDDDPLTGVKTHPYVTTNESDDSLCYRDNDADGFGDASVSNIFISGTDCDDDDDTRYPDAQEVCDGLDNDCNGSIPEDEIDNDNDGYVECDVGIWKADGPIKQGGDCNDDVLLIYPYAQEICDGRDNDCQNGIRQEEQDNDGDRYVECTIAIIGWKGTKDVDGGDDCDDTDKDKYPGAASLDSSSACYSDKDGDNYAPISEGGTDCDDNNESKYPGAPEVCDGIVNSCDGTLPTDEIDDDGDGYVECTILGNWEGTVQKQGGDCDDDPSTGMNTFPGSAEHELDDKACYRDDDNDGYGDIFASGGIITGTDCADDDQDMHPNADEICDSNDQNCNGNIDEQAVDALMWYEDSDGDGFGNAEQSIRGCSQPDNYVDNQDDCNDDIFLINPSRNEVYYDGIDQNCDGQDDYDADGDGFIPEGFCPFENGDPNDCIAYCYEVYLTDSIDGLVEIEIGNHTVSLESDDCELSNDFASSCSSDTENCLCTNSQTVCARGNHDIVFTKESASRNYYFSIKSLDHDDFRTAENDNTLLSTSEDIVISDGRNTLYSMDYEQDCSGYDENLCKNIYDCNDSQQSMNPDGLEICDGYDNDCNGEIDENAPQTYSYSTPFAVDNDNDGWFQKVTDGCLSNQAMYDYFDEFQDDIHYAEDCNDMYASQYPYNENADFGCRMELEHELSGSSLGFCEGFLLNGNNGAVRVGHPQSGDVYFLYCSTDMGIDWRSANEACINSGLYDGLASFSSESELNAFEENIFFHPPPDDILLVHFGYSTYQPLSIQNSGNLVSSNPKQLRWYDDNGSNYSPIELDNSTTDMCMQGSYRFSFFDETLNGYEFSLNACNSAQGRLTCSKRF